MVQANMVSIGSLSYAGIVSVAGFTQPRM